MFIYHFLYFFLLRFYNLNEIFAYLLCALPGGVLTSEITLFIGPMGVLGLVPPVKQAPLKGEQALLLDFLIERFLNISLFIKSAQKYENK